MEQKLVGPSKQLKQLIQTEHNIVKNPKWPEANQLAICKHGRGFELGATEKQEQDLNLGPLDCDSDTLTTQPHCLHPLLGHCARIVVTK